MLSMQNRRLHDRQALDQEVTAKIGGRHGHALITDISQGGAFLESDLALRQGQDVVISNPITGESVIAGVRRIETEGAGLQFDDEAIWHVIGGWGGTPVKR